MQDNISCYKIQITGIVQGVGFRPHVYRLATEMDLKGWVLNSSFGVCIEVEGLRCRLDEFSQRLSKSPPPLAFINNYSVNEIPPSGYNCFIIKKSESNDNREVMISPDIAMCADCRQEILDASDRRYLYPFTNCTNCGPRFTIIKDVPYDRNKTTMASFPMCPQCREEYENPLNRRFHAQPNACPVCGPHITLLDRNQEVVDAKVTDIFKKGFVVAVKSLGGFHLAADARNPEAVTRLRQRKKRDSKPFAVMAKDLSAARKYCEINADQEKHLTSRQAPIVVMKCLKDNGLPAKTIHPGLNTLGVILPYTPLHFLLFDEELDILLMTSANISDEPLIIDNDTAFRRLNGVADYFLVNNREIYNPCDDSVIGVAPSGTPHFFRRARGYVPAAIHIPTSKSAGSVLATGSELKNTFCITRDSEAYLSQHWGDLNHYNNYRNFVNGIKRFKDMLTVKPHIIAHDLHPEYQATRWAKSQEGVELIGVQHHHAHMASVMAEHNLKDEVLGLICDGSGWGTDGAVWGCELLKGAYRGFSRLGHLKYLPLIGGDLTSRRPYRMAFIYMVTALGLEGIKAAEHLLPNLTPVERDIIINLMKSPNEPQTSSCGRLFDAVGAALGISPINHHEGQSAIELEAAADYGYNGVYSYSIYEQDGMSIMNPLPMWPELLEDIHSNLAKSSIARKFHSTMASMFSEILIKTREETRLNKVVLSGGVFHNQLLLSELLRILQSNNFDVYQHQQVPPGDGGISLGQAVIASER